MERGVGFCVLPDAAFVTCFESRQSISPARRPVGIIPSSRPVCTKHRSEMLS